MSFVDALKKTQQESFRAPYEEAKDRIDRKPKTEVKTKK